MSFTIILLITICTKNGPKKVYFQKPGKNFQKTYGHPVAKNIKKYAH